MALTLPYEFDTTDVVKWILRGVLGLAAIVVLGIVYSLFVSHRMAAVVQLLLIGALVIYFGRIFFRNLTGSSGEITRDAVTVRPARLYGLPLASPAGSFRVQQFSAVRVERIFGPQNTPSPPRWHERVWLAGSADTPDILVGRTDLGAGTVLGRELAAALGLPYEESVKPY